MDKDFSKEEKDGLYKAIFLDEMLDRILHQNQLMKKF